MLSKLDEYKAAASLTYNFQANKQIEIISDLIGQARWIELLEISNLKDEHHEYLDSAFPDLLRAAYKDMPCEPILNVLKVLAENAGSETLRNQAQMAIQILSPTTKL